MAAHHPPENRLLTVAAGRGPGPGGTALAASALARLLVEPA
ncbi:hypothetical protein [Streptomyces sp. TUS-ST3]|nr:hypothetical protein [Streptomyces sp. TUS-ST3]